MADRHTEPLTDTLIRRLQNESGAAGDSHMDHLCSLALEGDEDGREACAEAINAARAMIDLADQSEPAPGYVLDTYDVGQWRAKPEGGSWKVGFLTEEDAIRWTWSQISLKVIA